MTQNATFHRMMKSTTMTLLILFAAYVIFPQEGKFTQAFNVAQQKGCFFGMIRHPTQSSFAYSKRTTMKMSAESSARLAIDWIKTQPFDTLLPKEDTLAILTEILSNDELLNDSEELVTKNLDSLERKIREEKRSTSELLGAETTKRILTTVQNLNEYDAQAVNSFLESDAINALFSQVLYDGIFEFFQKIDVFGNIVNSLPIIGPIRKQIVSETKRQLDRSLGPLVKSFLTTYTKIAVREAADFVLSEENRKAFGGANVKLVKSLLDRPINSLLPSSGDTLEKLKKEVFDYLRKVDVKEDLEEYVDFVYDLVGDKSVDRFVNVNRVLDASPTLSRTIDTVWNKAIAAGEDNEEEGGGGI